MGAAMDMPRMTMKLWSTFSCNCCIKELCWPTITLSQARPTGFLRGMFLCETVFNSWCKYLARITTVVQGNHFKELSLYLSFFDLKVPHNTSVFCLSILKGPWTPLIWSLEIINLDLSYAASQRASQRTSPDFWIKNALAISRAILSLCLTTL